MVNDRQPRHSKEATMFARPRGTQLALVSGAVLSGAVLLGGIALAGAAAPWQGAWNAAESDVARTAPTPNHGEIGGILDTLVKNGVITADQKAKIVEAFEAARAAHRKPGGVAFKASLEEIAKAIGITVEQLRQEWPGKSLAQVAQAHGVSRDTLIQRLTAAATARIDKAVTENKITAEQATNMKARLPEFLAKTVDQVHDRKQAQPLLNARKFLGNLTEEAATAIGITAAQLKQELPGKSLAQVAQAHGLSRDALIQKVTAAATARIDRGVTENKLSAEDAARIKSGLAEAVAKSVDHVFGTRTPPAKP